ncbi:hypothetical protein [Thermaerobacter litoralis]
MTVTEAEDLGGIVMPAVDDPQVGTRTLLLWLALEGVPPPSLKPPLQRLARMAAMHDRQLVEDDGEHPGVLLGVGEGLF